MINDKLDIGVTVETCTRIWFPELANVWPLKEFRRNPIGVIIFICKLDSTNLTLSNKWKLSSNRPNPLVVR